MGLLSVAEESHGLGICLCRETDHFPADDEHSHITG